jgi:hypothetical protein
MGGDIALLTLDDYEQLIIPSDQGTILPNSYIGSDDVISSLPNRHDTTIVVFLEDLPPPLSGHDSLRDAPMEVAACS